MRKSTIYINKRKGQIYGILLIQNNGDNYVHYEVLDKAGNRSTGYFVYTLTKSTSSIQLSNTGTGKSIKLTAVLTHVNSGAEPLTGTVFFKCDGAVIGQAAVTDGKAEITWNPSTKGNKTVTAIYTGNAHYSQVQSDCSFRADWADDDDAYINVYVNPIANTAGKAPTVGLPNTQNVINSVSGTGRHVPPGSSIVLDAEELKDDQVSKSDRLLIAGELDDKMLGTYLDLSLYLVTGSQRTQITKLNSEIEVCVLIPEELRANGRIFSIVLVHNGVTYVLEDLDDDPNTVTFRTRLFSTYALVYDLLSTANPPKTGDASTTAGYIMLVIGAAAFAILRRRLRMAQK